VQGQVLHLGELTDSQCAGWLRAIKALNCQGAHTRRQMALFPDDLPCEAVPIHISGIRLHRPRQWGAHFPALWLWNYLELDRFWGSRLEASREGTRWLNVLKMLTVYRLIDPGSEDDRCHPLDDDTLSIAEGLWKKNAPFRRLLAQSEHIKDLIHAKKKRNPRHPVRIKNHTFAITGKFVPTGRHWIYRRDLIAMVVKLGGKMSDDVVFAARADCLVETYLDLKRAIAKESGTPRMTPDDFWE
jgi:hypothetical protein